MARQLRIQAPGLTYHVWARGNGKQTVFADDRDRRSFLQIVAEAFELHEVNCHAYCEMDTHYHLVVTTLRANLSSAIKRVDGLYAQWWNHRHKHVGHVFQGRFGAQIVQDDAYLLTVCRYVVLNPVRAGLVRRPQDWPWSSYRATAGVDPPQPFLRPEGLWRQLGSNEPRDGQRRYREFVNERASDAVEPPRARILGDDTFVERLAAARMSISAEVPRVEHTPRPPLPSFFDGAITRLQQRDRAALACRAGYCMAEVARFLQIHYSTVGRMVKAAGAASCAPALRTSAPDHDRVPDRAECGDARCDPT